MYTPTWIHSVLMTLNRLTINIIRSLWFTSICKSIKVLENIKKILINIDKYLQLQTQSHKCNEKSWDLQIQRKCDNYRNIYNKEGNLDKYEESSNKYLKIIKL